MGVDVKSVLIFTSPLRSGVCASAGVQDTGNLCKMEISHGHLGVSRAYTMWRCHDTLENFMSLKKITILFCYIDYIYYAIIFCTWCHVLYCYA